MFHLCLTCFTLQALTVLSSELVKGRCGHLPDASLRGSSAQFPLSLMRLPSQRQCANAPHDLSTRGGTKVEVPIFQIYTR